MRTKLLVVLLLVSIAAFGQQNPIQIDANGLTQTLASGGLVTRGQIVKINSSGQVVPMLTTDTSGAVGIAATSQQNQGQSVAVSIAGTPLVQIDSGGCAAGNVVSISSITAGFGHCAATASGQQIGIALSISSSGSTFWNIQLSPLSSAGASSTGASPSGGGSVYVGPSCPNPNSANCYFANFDTQMAFTVTCNNTSSTITIGANDPPFKAADVGKLIAGTTGVGAAAGCPPQGTITGFTNATTVTVSVAATQTTTTGVLAWGHNDGAAIQNAFAASLTRGACLYLTEGGAFFDIPPFLDQRLGSAVGTPPCVKGTGNTRLIPLPSFNYSNCITNDACVFKFSNATNLNPNYAELEDFEVISPGYNLTGSGATNNIFNLQRVTMKNVWLWNWGGSTSVGAIMTGPNAIYDLNVQNSGSTNCNATGIGGNQTNVLTNSYCFSMSMGGVLYTSGSTFGGVGNGPSNTCAGSWLSSGDVYIPPASGQDTIRVNGACNLILDNAQVVGATGNTNGALNCNVSGGNVQLRGNTTIDGGASSGKTINSVAGCTVNNQSGGLAKVITHTPGTFSLSGNSIGQPSEIQTGTCSTNAATVTFKYTYSIAPLVSVSDTTSASTGAQATATNTTTATIHCNGASDTFVATVYPNPI